MLSNVNRSLLLYLLIGIIIIAVLVIVGGTILAIIKAYRKGEHSKRKCIFLTLLCIAIAATSWIFNMGWIRFIMTFMLIPFIHAIIFFLINFFTASYIHKSKKLRHINIFFCFTYLLFYILLPDGGDVGEMYVFFGLIHSNLFSSICNTISSLAVFVHIVLFILQTIEIVKTKKLIANEQKNQTIQS